MSMQCQSVQESRNTFYNQRTQRVYGPISPTAVNSPVYWTPITTNRQL